MLEYRGGKNIMGCEHCNIEICPVLNKSECPISKLWERAKEALEAVAEAEMDYKRGRDRWHIK